ncbi:1,4-dihydroxy-2-naphthoate polyprenyltransferase, partial [Staphylococcus sp. GDX7P312P]
MANKYKQYYTVRKYWHLMRTNTLNAAVLPVLVGTATAKLFLLGIQDNIKFMLFIALLIACLIIQAATKMFNEYY